MEIMAQCKENAVMKYHIPICLLLLFMLTAGCTEQQEEKPLHFRFIAPCVDEEFFDPVKKGMRDAAAMMNVTCEFVGTEDVDLELQASMVIQAVEDGVDGIALNIIDREVFDDVVQEAMNRGVPVVAFNVDDNGTENARLSGIVQDFYNAGNAVGRYMAGFMPSGSKVLLLLHSEGISALDDRLRGEQDALKAKNITWEILVTGIDPEAAAGKIADKLNQHPDIHYVLGTGQADTEGAGLAIEKHFRDKGIKAAGFDLSPEILRLIQEDIILVTVDQQPYMQGFYPVVQLALYCRYGLKPSSMDAGAGLITKDQVASVLQLSEAGYR